MKQDLPLYEQLILKAVEEGALENLPGKGKPLHFEDESHVPESMRMTFRILKNSGYHPPEVEMMKEIEKLNQAIEAEDNEATKKSLIKARKEQKLKLQISLEHFAKRHNK